MPLRSLKYRENDENSHWPLAWPLFFMLQELIVAFWHHTNKNFGGILTDCTQDFSKVSNIVACFFPLSLSRLSSINHSVRFTVLSLISVLKNSMQQYYTQINIDQGTI